MTDITILSCPQCGFPKIRDCGNGLYQCDDCGSHFDKDENIVQTNEEYLRSLNTEQLANVFFEYRYINATPQQQLWLSANEDFVKGGIVEWLKQPHKE